MIRGFRGITKASNLLCGDDYGVMHGHVGRETCSHDLDHAFKIFPGLARIIRDRYFLGVYQLTRYE